MIADGRSVDGTVVRSQGASADPARVRSYFTPTASAWIHEADSATAGAGCYQPIGIVHY